MFPFYSILLGYVHNQVILHFGTSYDSESGVIKKLTLRQKLKNEKMSGLENGPCYLISQQILTFSSLFGM